jgi:hypothetical protein
MQVSGQDFSRAVKHKRKSFLAPQAGVPDTRTSRVVGWGPRAARRRAHKPIEFTHAAIDVINSGVLTPAHGKAFSQHEP